MLLPFARRLWSASQFHPMSVSVFEFLFVIPAIWLQILKKMHKTSRVTVFIRPSVFYSCFSFLPFAATQNCCFICLKMKPCAYPYNVFCEAAVRPIIYSLVYHIRKVKCYLLSPLLPALQLSGIASILPFVSKFN